LPRAFAAAVFAAAASLDIFRAPLLCRFAAIFSLAGFGYYCRLAAIAIFAIAIAMRRASMIFSLLRILLIYFIIILR